MIQKSLHIVNQVRRAFKDPEMQKVYDLFRECEVRRDLREPLNVATSMAHKLTLLVHMNGIRINMQHGQLD
jgi:hypothetical protein